MGEDRHKAAPKAVRIPGGLLTWINERAEAESRSVNSVIVAALEEYRAKHGGSTTEAGGTTTTTVSGSTTTAGGSTTGEGKSAPKRRRTEPAAEAPRIPPALSDLGLTVASALPKPGAPRPPRCTHAGTRIIGGWCGECDRMVGAGGL